MKSGIWEGDNSEDIRKIRVQVIFLPNGLIKEQFVKICSTVRSVEQ